MAESDNLGQLWGSGRQPRSLAPICLPDGGQVDVRLLPELEWVEDPGPDPPPGHVGHDHRLRGRGGRILLCCWRGLQHVLRGSRDHGHGYILRRGG